MCTQRHIHQNIVGLLSQRCWTRAEIESYSALTHVFRSPGLCLVSGHLLVELVCQALLIQAGPSTVIMATTFIKMRCTQLRVWLSKGVLREKNHVTSTPQASRFHMLMNKRRLITTQTPEWGCVEETVELVYGWLNARYLLYLWL